MTGNDTESFLAGCRMPCCNKVSRLLNIEIEALVEPAPTRRLSGPGGVWHLEGELQIQNR